MISIIIPVYNGNKLLRDCLRALRVSLMHYDCEILIVDDKSEDNPSKIVAEFKSDNVVFLRNHRNLGFARTVTRGVYKAKGEIIVLLNMDTVVDKDWLRELIAPLMQDPAVGLTGSKILYMDNSSLQHAGGFLNEIALAFHIGKGEADRGQYDNMKEVEYVCGASMAFRRKLFEKIGGLDSGYSPLYYEEIDMATKIRRAGYKILYIPTSRLRHYGEYTVNGNRIGLFYLASRNRLRYVLKTYSLRRLLFCFIHGEIIYFLKNDTEKKKCLLKIYFYTFLRIPEILIARLRDYVLLIYLKFKDRRRRVI